jgi:hypothetical protein
VPETLPSSAEGPRVSVEAYRDGPLGPYLTAKRLRDLNHAPDALPAEGSQSVLFAPWLLQDIADYRYALQRWFACVETGGFLIVIVPHAFLHDRRAQLPSPWRPGQKRLYTPASLLAEVEEALTPNSYRIRWLGDDDAGYDYALDRATPPVGRQNIALVIERIHQPAWTLVSDPAPAGPAPGPIFEPVRTRIEVPLSDAPVRTILLLKLDHLGDFILSLPAIRAVRAHFPSAHITLAVGTWNEALATETGLADKVVPFDAFSRNPVEDGYLDMAARAEAFAALMNGSYDLAIDLRTFADTRSLLAQVDARHRAGIGSRAIFPFLDIALPVDTDAEQLGYAEIATFSAVHFKSDGRTRREEGSIRFRTDGAPQPWFALVWGPYRRLEIGDYILRPAIEINSARGGVLAFDVVVDQQECASGQFDVWGADVEFRVEQPGAFEFRLWTVDGHALPDFDFKGCRLYRRAVPAELHQSEIQRLLIDLVAMRLAIPADGDAG